jgi:hypothetical protein
MNVAQSGYIKIQEEGKGGKGVPTRKDPRRGLEHVAENVDITESEDQRDS